MIYVLGHKTPDTDATCTPIVVAWYLQNVRKIEAEAVLHGNPSKEAQFALDYWKIPSPKVVLELPDQADVFVLDTSNPEELPLIKEGTNIVEIVDHHKLGGLSTDSPTQITIRPWGCTATVWYNQVKDSLTQPLPKEMAGLLASAIISDTLQLRSPTTTDHDRQTLAELAQLAGITAISEYANEMFTAKSSIDGMDLLDIIKSDFKEFVLKDKKVFVGTFETVKPELVLEKLSDLVLIARKFKADSSYDQVYFFIVDIFEQNAYYVPVSDEEGKVITRGFEVEVSADPDHVTTLEGVVSRKKQIIPVLEANI